MPTLPVNHSHSEMLSKFYRTIDRNKLNLHAKVDEKNDAFHDIGIVNEKNSLNCSLINYYDPKIRNNTENELSCQLHIGYDSISFDTSISFSNSNSFLFYMRLSGDYLAFCLNYGNQIVVYILFWFHSYRF